MDPGNVPTDHPHGLPYQPFAPTAERNDGTTQPTEMAANAQGRRGIVPGSGWVTTRIVPGGYKSGGGKNPDGVTFCFTQAGLLKIFDEHGAGYGWGLEVRAAILADNLHSHHGPVISTNVGPQANGHQFPPIDLSANPFPIHTNHQRMAAIGARRQLYEDVTHEQTLNPNTNVRRQQFTRIHNGFPSVHDGANSAISGNSANGCIDPTGTVRGHSIVMESQPSWLPLNNTTKSTIRPQVAETPKLVHDCLGLLDAIGSKHPGNDVVVLAITNMVDRRRLEGPLYDPNVVLHKEFEFFNTSTSQSLMNQGLRLTDGRGLSILKFSHPDWRSPVPAARSTRRRRGGREPPPWSPAELLSGARFVEMPQDHPNPPSHHIMHGCGQFSGHSHKTMVIHDPNLINPYHNIESHLWCFNLLRVMAMDIGFGYGDHTSILTPFRSSDMHISVLDIDSMGIRNGYSRIDEQRLMHWLQYSKNHDSNRAPTLVTQRKGNDFLDLLNTTRQNEHQRDCSNYVAFGVDALPQHVHDNNCTGCAWGDVFSTSIA